MADSSVFSAIQEITSSSEEWFANIEPPPSAFTYADTQFDILKRYILQFESTLEPDREVGIMFTHFGHSVVMQVIEIGYEDPVLMIFKGFVDGHLSTLIQHVSQLNFLLTSVPKEPDRPKRQIGFSSPRAGAAQS